MPLYRTGIILKSKWSKKFPIGPKAHLSDGLLFDNKPLLLQRSVVLIYTHSLEFFALNIQVNIQYPSTYLTKMTDVCILTQTVILS